LEGNRYCIFFLKQEFPPHDFPGLIEPFQEGEVVDIITNSLLEHPLHLHGYKVWYLGGGAGTYDGSQPLNLINPVPLDVYFNGGPAQCCPPAFPTSWSVIRIYAYNPGLWLQHCHLDDHMTFGMKWLLAVYPKFKKTYKEFVPVKVCDFLDDGNEGHKGGHCEKCEQSDDDESDCDSRSGTTINFYFDNMVS